MGFAINLFTTPRDQLVPLVTRAEELGFEAVWLAEHLIRPGHLESTYPYSETNTGWPETTPLRDPWVVFGHLAAVTERIQLASGVYVLPLRNPFVVARAVGTAHELSAGRVILGVGAGWCREEFEAVGEDFDGRGSRMDEMMTILRELWSGERVAHDGAWYRFGEVVYAPPPSPPVPLVVGGNSRPARRRAAYLGDGWYAPAILELDQLTAARDEIDEMRAEAGRADLPFTYHVRMRGDLDAANAQRYRSAGFHHVAIGTNQLWRGDFELSARLEMLEGLAADLDLV